MSELASLRAELQELRQQFLARANVLERRIVALELAVGEAKHADKALPPAPEDSVIEEAEETDDARLARLKGKPRSALTEEQTLELDILEEKEELRKLKEQKERYQVRVLSRLVFSPHLLAGSAERATAAAAAAAAAARAAAGERRVGPGRAVELAAGKGQEARNGGAAVAAQGATAAHLRG